jgi:hypothetical protein
MHSSVCVREEDEELESVELAMLMPAAKMGDARLGSLDAREAEDWLGYELRAGR